MTKILIISQDSSLEKQVNLTLKYHSFTIHSVESTPPAWKLLTEIVQEHSDGMVAGTVAFGHGGFSSRCTEGRVAIGGGNWCGENVAQGQKSQAAAFSAWMNSSGHRANIENSRATHTGFAYAKSSGGTIYWTQIFLEQN